MQGVGFRPFVYRLATELNLAGWVSNSAEGVFLEVEGDSASLETFILRLRDEKPPRAFIQSLESSILDPVGHAGFVIRESERRGTKSALVLPDIGTCPDCLAEVFDPGNRRFLYPFTNCTNCGPRFSIIEGLPYDRATTSMKQFTMCPECRAEYENPLDRRFHAQPNACPRCGPHLELWAGGGKALAQRGDALLEAAEAIRRGRIVAVKGLGGFHLVADARSETAVTELRRRKHREEKPFALMFPDLAAVREECSMGKLEERLLQSPESPIVLLSRRNGLSGSSVCEGVAPGNPYLGIMLPYTPLHHILMRELGFPIVATSGNLSDEPICTDEREALRRLAGIGDLFLVHNRPIVRHVDDSIVRVMLGRELVVRRARGYAPLPVPLLAKVPRSTLGVGAHLKNTVALAREHNVFISQHIGDLESSESLDAFRRVITDFERLFEVTPQAVASDLHPDYLSTKEASRHHNEVIGIQHHLAHIASCMAENEIDGDVLGVSWDGTGFGTDGTVWGGEFLTVDPGASSRIGTLRPFRLPGGEQAVKEPRRTALGVLFEMMGTRVFSNEDLLPVREFRAEQRRLLEQMLLKGINAPVCTSVGRLFDAAASLLGIRQVVRHEGQAAMELEFTARHESGSAPYPAPFLSRTGMTAVMPTHENPEGPLQVFDWAPMFEGMLADRRRGMSLPSIAWKFHTTLVEVIVNVARFAGRRRVVLSGGCFQNKILTELAVTRLLEENFVPYWHQRVPPNDGGIALGQIVAASWLFKEASS